MAREFWTQSMQPEENQSVNYTSTYRSSGLGKVGER